MHHTPWTMREEVDTLRADARKVEGDLHVVPTAAQIKHLTFLSTLSQVCPTLTLVTIMFVFTINMRYQEFTLWPLTLKSRGSFRKFTMQH